jgi:pyridoxal 5-phosphate dependent beta-lyase
MSGKLADTPSNTGTWRDWAAQRLPAEGLHLDSAACGRSAVSVLDAVKAHLDLEARAGGYVAQERAAPVLNEGRAALAGLLGVPVAGLALTESATASFRTLLAAWPLKEGDVVAVVPSEWGPNLEKFADRGAELSFLAVTGDGLVDLEALERRLAGSPPALVHLTQVASHRGLVQPVAAAAELCRAAGVPLWVDAAQAIGHTGTACGADVIYATSRKWLTGPRGVGLIGIAEPWWGTLRVRIPAMLGDAPPVRALESDEANGAGRIGLAEAVRLHLAAGPETVRARLAEVGQMTREVLGDLPGWEVAGAADAPCSTTALRPLDGQDPLTVRRRLLDEHKIVTSASAVARAPREMTGPMLRVSGHVDTSAEDLFTLRSALAGLAG